MGNPTYPTGSITINPPVPAARLADSAFTANGASQHDKEVFVSTDTSDPDLYVEIHPVSEEGTNVPEEISDHLDELLALIGPGHTYSGQIDCEGPNGPHDLWRIHVVDGAAFEEDAHIVYPADHRIPAGPAVTFNSTAARAWLTETVPTTPSRRPVARATTFGVEPDETYDPSSYYDRPGAWLTALITALHNDAAAPNVWQTAPTADIDVIETHTMQDDPDGGAVLVLFIAGTRLATHRIQATDFAAYTTDPAGNPDKLQIDAVIETLATAARQLNTILDNYRTAQLAAQLTAPTGPGTSTAGLAGQLSPDDIETALHTLAELATGANWNADLSTAQRTVAITIAHLRQQQREPAH
ncbi:DUF6205 family protein [Dactylosporangium sp. NPDC050688]|uniref:DUF6205 family protein n=1 Tax=Dactylosporangium sp. NPDC050688 TaxID=3157217 RepID=UPI00340AA020